MKEFLLSLYQTLVLLLWNDKDELNYEEIYESTKIGKCSESLLAIFHLFLNLFFLEESELKRTVQSLACGKVPILNKSSKVI